MSKVLDKEVLLALIVEEKIEHYTADIANVTAKKVGYNLCIDKMIELVESLANGDIDDSFIKHIMTRGK